MIPAALVVLPALAGAGIWALIPAGGARVRTATGGAAAAALTATLGLALVAAATGASAGMGWGAGLELALAVPPLAGAVAVTVPAVALATGLYAAAHEPVDGLPRLVGLLVAFTGAMELVVVAADLLTLVIGWELVAALSWALIGHRWRDASRPARAAHAFNATRAGGLGLVLAAGAALAATGGLAYTDLAALDPASRHVLAAGVVLAAVAKSAQVPFAPWLFSAMAGPTPVSALLHSATMVAAGAYLLARLQPVLAPTGWFAPLVVTVGLVTALAGGVVAVVQRRVKHLLAASTSAQHGLMLVAVGAGYPLVAVAHLVAHAAAKSLLFLAAGTATAAVGSETLTDLRAGSHRRAVAISAAVGSLALAAVPPLGAAWSKEQVVAAAADWRLLAGLATIVAGGLAALYAARFQLVVFARTDNDARAPAPPPGRIEVGVVVALAAASLGLGVAWLTPVEELVATAGALAPRHAGELLASLGAIAAGIAAAVVGDRAGWLARLGHAGASRWAGGWLGLPAASRHVLVEPTSRLARLAGRVDTRVAGGARAVGRLGARGSTRAATADVRVVDAGVRGLAALTRLAADRWSRAAELGVDGTVRAVAGSLASSAGALRRLQSGAAHHYLTAVTVGAAVAVLVAAVGS